MFHLAFIWEGGLNIPLWIIPVAIVYFLWRGSKIAWWVSVVTTAVGVPVAIAEIVSARDPGGQDPALHVVQAVFVALQLVLLLLPATRRFYELEDRALAQRR